MNFRAKYVSIRLIPQFENFPLDFMAGRLYNTVKKSLPKRRSFMENQYGSDFITITDEDGKEYELEVLTTVEYNGDSYMAVIPAGAEDDDNLEVSILKSIEEDGEPILCAIEDEEELKAVYDLIMDQLYEEEEDDE